MKKKTPRVSTHSRVATTGPRIHRLLALLESAEHLLDGIPPSELKAGGDPVLIALSVAVEQARTKLLRAQGCTEALERANAELRCAGNEVRRLTDLLTSECHRPSSPALDDPDEARRDGL